MIIELPDHEVASGDLGPTKERVGLQLHGLLPFRGALPVVVGGARIRQVRGVARRRLLLDLQEQRVFSAIAFE